MTAVAASKTPLPMADRIDALVEGLKRMSLDELRAEWVRRQKRPAPACQSKELLRGLLAYAIQEKAFKLRHRNLLAVPDALGR